MKGDDWKGGLDYVPEPWAPAKATERIRAIARADFTLNITGHAKEQMQDRSILIGDLMLARYEL